MSRSIASLIIISLGGVSAAAEPPCGAQLQGKASKVYRFLYDGGQRLTEVVYLLGSRPEPTYRFGYDAQGRLTRHEQAGRVVVTLNWDAEGRLSRARMEQPHQRGSAWTEARLVWEQGAKGGRPPRALPQSFFWLDPSFRRILGQYALLHLGASGVAQTRQYACTTSGCEEKPAERGRITADDQGRLVRWVSAQLGAGEKQRPEVRLEVTYGPHGPVGSSSPGATGAESTRWEYDGQGRLVTLTDQHADHTTIFRVTWKSAARAEKVERIYRYHPRHDRTKYPDRREVERLFLYRCPPLPRR